jgi:hypothetical protein
MSSTGQLLKAGDFTSVRFSFALLRDDECYRDLDEAAGAADATACSTSSEWALFRLK